MKTRTPILSKCIAVLLAVMLAFSNVPGIMVTAFAAEHAVSAGHVMAETYDLPDAVEAILESGYLTMDYSIEYDDPKDNWVTVDHENKTITAEEKDGWVATDAHIVVNGTSVEDVVLTDGEGTYTYDENGFLIQETMVRTYHNSYNGTTDYRYTETLTYTNDDQGYHVTAEFTTDNTSNNYQSYIITYNYEDLYFYNAD